MQGAHKIGNQKRSWNEQSFYNKLTRSECPDIKILIMISNFIHEPLRSVSFQKPIFLENNEIWSLELSVSKNA